LLATFFYLAIKYISIYLFIFIISVERSLSIAFLCDLLQTKHSHNNNKKEHGGRVML